MRWGHFKSALACMALVLLVSVGLLSGCAKKTIGVSEEGTFPTEQIKGTGPVAGQEAMGEGEGAEAGFGEAVIPGEEMPGEKTPAGAPAYGDEISEGRTHAPLLPIFFDFDRFSIQDDMKARMEENARFLLDHPSIRIEIQGNCDERGTNEYNLALGERRARSAKAYLVNLGINPDRIETVSFGEENPLALGQDDAAWAENRRADFVIIK